ncbi:concanavalin A-like lectin/glucanase domain-containing protein [Fomes fomentarius]|nr:concanavalin A-like lectin/glucanase domain-containing protein [Fomes fomentarius]
MRPLASFAPIVLFMVSPVLSAYDLVDEYSGLDFFTKWDYGNKDGYDSTTHGAVNWLGQSPANTSGLVAVNSKGNAVIKVDDKTNLPPAAPGDFEHQLKRNSVLLSSQAFYPIGSVIVFDAVHVPAGCSVWPALWTRAQDWPHGGEIDIIEGVNLMSTNRMTIHTDPGCTHQNGAQQRGTTVGADCSAGPDSATGCTVEDKLADSFGKGLNAAGGGVWAAQIDASGIFMWFWSRKDVPDDVTNAKSSVEPSSKWGTPVAAWPSSSCDIGKFFKPQQLVIDITLCGDFAGEPTVYSQSGCTSTPPADVAANTCYTDNVDGDGSNYAEAYFEISSIKVFSLSNSDTSTSDASSSVSSGTALARSTSVSAPTGGPSSGATNSALRFGIVSGLRVTALVAAFRIVATLMGM